MAVSTCTKQQLLKCTIPGPDFVFQLKPASFSQGWIHRSVFHCSSSDRALTPWSSPAQDALQIVLFSMQSYQAADHDLTGMASAEGKIVLNKFDVIVPNCLKQKYRFGIPYGLLPGCPFEPMIRLSSTLMACTWRS